MDSLVIPARAPFRFDLALAYLTRSDDEVLDVVEDGTHRRVISLASGTALLEISSASDGESPALEVAVLAGAAAEDDLRKYVSRLYRLDDDRAGLPVEEPLAAQLVEHFAGLPLVQAGSPYEALVWAIIGQQINVQFAYRVKRAFVETFGERIPFAGRDYFAFPTPEQVVELTHEEHLWPLQFSRQKSRYIVALSEAILDDRLDFEGLAGMDDEDALSSLQTHLGVGRWTAEYVMMRGLARRDFIPAADIGLRAAVGGYLGLDGNASEAQVREISDAWRPYRSDLAFMLWFSLQNGWFNKKGPRGG